MRKTIEVAGVEIRVGEGCESHKPYTKYIITGMDGIKYSTFDKPSKLNQVVAGAKLTLDCTATDKAKQMNILTIVSIETPSVASIAKAGIAKPKEDISLAPLPDPLTEEQIASFLDEAEAKAREKIRGEDYTRMDFTPLVNMLFTAKLQKQAQEYSVSMSRHVQSTKESNMAKGGLRG